MADGPASHVANLDGTQIIGAVRQAIVVLQATDELTDAPVTEPVRSARARGTTGSGLGQRVRRPRRRAGTCPSRPCHDRDAVPRGRHRAGARLRPVEHGRRVPRTGRVPGLVQCERPRRRAAAPPAGEHRGDGVAGRAQPTATVGRRGRSRLGALAAGRRPRPGRRRRRPAQPAARGVAGLAGRDGPRQRRPARTGRAHPAVGGRRGPCASLDDRVRRAHRRRPGRARPADNDRREYLPVTGGDTTDAASPAVLQTGGPVRVAHATGLGRPTGAAAARRPADATVTAAPSREISPSSSTPSPRSPPLRSSAPAAAGWSTSTWTAICSARPPTRRGSSRLPALSRVAAVELTATGGALSATARFTPDYSSPTNFDAA